MVGQSVFQAAVVLVGSLAAALCALAYFRRVRMERPPIGTFNGRDVVILLVFIVVLPILYLMLPSAVLVGFLLLTFVSAMYIGLRPLLKPRVLWPAMAVLIAANFYATYTMLGTRSGWQVYWGLTDVVVLIAAVGVSNLYVQGGMQLRHVAWFALLLAGYDAFFSLVIPLTPKLADAFEGRPLDASIGFVLGTWNANVGLGDVLIYCLFATAAYRAFGRRGALASLAVIAVFGSIIPGLAPLALQQFVRGGVGVVVPAQVFFGPIALLTYLWMARRYPQRTPSQWLVEQAGRPTVSRSTTPARPSVRAQAPRSIPTVVAVPVAGVEEVAAR
jgi:hypothetical protein